MHACKCGMTYIPPPPPHTHTQGDAEHDVRQVSSSIPLRLTGTSHTCLVELQSCPLGQAVNKRAPGSLYPSPSPYAGVTGM